MSEPPLRILHVEDVPADAELAERELRRAAFVFETLRVETREEFLAALADFRPDLILSDYRLPEFDGMEALLLAREHAPDVPVIITTGSVNEETAVACMKAGAADYVLKEQLGRLGISIRAALERQQLLAERNRAAETLARSEAYYRSLIESGFDLTAVLNPDGCLRYASPSIERILGYKSDELIGRSVFELIHEGDQAHARERLRQAVVEGIHETIEVRFRHKDGSWRTLSAIGNGLPAETGVTGLVMSARDITDRLQLESKFRQAQKMEAVGRLAGGVAHDFNNLLTVIQGYGEMLVESLEGQTEKRESAGEIVTAAQRAAALTRQLLAFSRRQVLEMHVLDVGDIVAETEKMLKRLIGEDVAVRVMRPAALDRVKADPGQVTQVLLNLAVNARDAMPGGGRLTIELSNLTLDAPFAAVHETIPAGRYVLISMADTGCGMGPETLAHIFEPFFTTKAQGKGTGLGLATVYGIVRQSGGYVAVESAPGTGTTFRVYWPQCDEASDVEGLPSSRSLHGTETVLVVEDEPAVRAVAQSLLRKNGYTVLAAESGDAALEVLAHDQRPVHVLLTDVVMPGMNGRELSARVLAARPSVRAVLMSGYAADVLTRVDEAGVAGFLSKPFSERSLVEKVREVLDVVPAGAGSRAARVS